MASDIKVQRGNTSYTTSAATATISSVDTAKAFARIVGSGHSTSGPTVAENTNRNVDDWSSTVHLSSATQITVTPYGTGDGTSFRTDWEVWEYVGAAGGVNEFKVVHDAEHSLSATGPTDFLIGASSGLTPSKIVPYVSFRGSSSGRSSDRLECTVEIIDTGGNTYIRLTKFDGADTTVARVVAVEYTGSNWSVQQNIDITRTASGSDVTAVVSSVTWSQTMIQATFRGDQGLDETHCMVHPGADSTHVAAQWDNASNSTDHAMIFLISHPDLAVQRISEGEGTFLPTGSSTATKTFTAISNMAEAAVAIYTCCNGTGTAQPRAYCGAQLTSTSQVTLWRGRTSQPLRGDLELYDFSAITSGGTEAYAHPVTFAAAATGVSVSGGAAGEFTVTASNTTNVTVAGTKARTFAVSESNVSGVVVSGFEDRGFVVTVTASSTSVSVTGALGYEFTVSESNVSGLLVTVATSRDGGPATSASSSSQATGSSVREGDATVPAAATGVSVAGGQAHTFTITTSNTGVAAATFGSHKTNTQVPFGKRAFGLVPFAGRAAPPDAYSMTPTFTNVTGVTVAGGHQAHTDVTASAVSDAVAAGHKTGESTVTIATATSVPVSGKKGAEATVAASGGTAGAAVSGVKELSSEPHSGTVTVPASATGATVVGSKARTFTLSVNNGTSVVALGRLGAEGSASAAGGTAGAVAAGKKGATAGSVSVAASTSMYAGLVVGDGAMALWRLGEPSGSTAVDAAGAHDGTYTGTPTLGVAGLIAGDADTAVTFDGASDWVSIPNAADINTGGPYTQRTVELWFNPADVTTRQVLYEEGGATRGLSIYLDAGSLYFLGWDLAADDATTPWGPKWVSTAVTTGITHHAVLVFDQPGDRIEGYVDGVSVGSVSGVGNLFAHSDANAIGVVTGSSYFHDGSASAGHYFAGTVDEVALYPTALTGTQIAEHHSGGVGGTKAAEGVVAASAVNDATVSGKTARSDGVVEVNSTSFIAIGKENSLFTVVASNATSSLVSGRKATTAGSSSVSSSTGVLVSGGQGHTFTVVESNATAFSTVGEGSRSDTVAESNVTGVTVAGPKARTFTVTASAGNLLTVEGTQVKAFTAVFANTTSTVVSGKGAHASDPTVTGVTDAAVAGESERHDGVVEVVGSSFVVVGEENRLFTVVVSGVSDVTVVGSRATAFEAVFDSSTGIGAQGHAGLAGDVTLVSSAGSTVSGLTGRINGSLSVSSAVSAVTAGSAARTGSVTPVAISTSVSVSGTATEHIGGTVEVSAATDVAVSGVATIAGREGVVAVPPGVTLVSIPHHSAGRLYQVSASSTDSETVDGTKQGLGLPTVTTATGAVVAGTRFDVGSPYADAAVSGTSTRTGPVETPAAIGVVDTDVSTARTGIVTIVSQAGAYAFLRNPLTKGHPTHDPLSYRAAGKYNGWPPSRRSGG